jgi:hypothetical protein
MQIWYTEMENLLEFTIYFRESYSQPHWTVQILCEDCVLLVWADLQVFLYRQQDPKGEWQIHLVYKPYFFKLRPSSNPTNRNLIKSVRQKQTINIHNTTCVHTNVFLTMTETITPKLFSFRPESHCICVYVCVCACVCVLFMNVNGWLH